VPSEPVPIAFVFSSFEPGGTEQQMVQLIERLDRSRWKVHVVSMRSGGQFLNRVARSSQLVTFPVTSFRRPQVLSRLWSFARWCRQNRIAIAHTVDQPANIFGLAGASLAGVPVRIANRRYVNIGRTTIELSAQRLAYVKAHTIVANCRAAADRLIYERVPAHKIAIISNGIDATRYTERQPRRTLRRVIMVANLRPDKGHDVLIDAAARVLERVPDMQFELVGAGRLHASLVERAENRRVSHALTFSGHQDEIARRLSAADIFVLPSRTEAFPNAVLEAMAAGLPIVASDVGGIPELIDNGRSGLLIPTDDPAALADRLFDLASDPGWAAKLGAAARVDVLARYSFTRMVTEFQNLYARELAIRVAPPRPVAAA
jgi:glycosyltransferase involved in cell wall biosynthesis